MIGAHDGGLEGVSELHLRGHVRGEGGKRGSGNHGGGTMAWKEAAIARSGIDNAAVVCEAVKEAFGERPGEVHVEHGTGWRLAGEVKRSGREGGGASTAT